MRYNVPFVSQFEGLTDPNWRWRGCGIVSLYMLMRYWHTINPKKRTPPTIDTLLEQGTALGAYREGIGWTHRGLVELARQFGYDGFNADFASNGPNPKETSEAWDFLLDELKKGPVLASMYHYLDSSHGGGHIIVVTGFQDGLVSFNDPEEVNAKEGQKLIALTGFLHGFKNRFIVIR